MQINGKGETPNSLIHGSWFSIGRREKSSCSTTQLPNSIQVPLIQIAEAIREDLCD